jgi:hypothetical protein
MVNLTIDLAIPLEILTSGTEDHLTPAIENLDAESEVVNLVIVGLRNAEVFIKSVSIRSYRIGQ